MPFQVLFGGCTTILTVALNTNNAVFFDVSSFGLKKDIWWKITNEVSSLFQKVSIHLSTNVTIEGIKFLLLFYSPDCGVNPYEVSRNYVEVSK